MKFVITRTSCYNDEQPCEDAKWNGEIDEWGSKIWTIEINSVEELLALKGKVGCPIIVGSNNLEIYDGYRE